MAPDVGAKAVQDVCAMRSEAVQCQGQQGRAAACDAVFAGGLTGGCEAVLESCPELRWNDVVPHGTRFFLRNPRFMGA
jgi:hypothetical protein